MSQARLEEAATDPDFRERLHTWLAQQQRYLQNQGWFGSTPGDRRPRGIAYFSMEFGLGEALPIYSGGLDILSGDFLKAASDLGVPLTGIGLLYQQGYFRQTLDPDGRQGKSFPYNDPITLGFARRFAAYKRPNLLLQNPDRLAQLLCHPDRPVQLIVAGKAYPHDEEGKRLVHELTRFAARSDVWNRVVFLQDYDMALAQFLVAGIDVWLNTPRRPWEACGTSGMKVLVNGGIYRN